MSSKSILFLSYYFPPGPEVGGRRVEKLVGLARAQGWDVSVLTVRSPAAQDESPNVYYLESGRALLDDNERRIRESRRHKRYHKYIYHHFMRPRIRSLIGATLKRDFVVRAMELIDTKNVAVIVTTGPPFELHESGYQIKKRRPGVKWIADFRDPWAYYGRLGPGLRERMKIQRDLKRCLDTADLVTAVTQSILDSLLSKSASHRQEQFLLVPNGVDLDLYNRAQPSGFEPVAGLNIGHLGDITYEHRNPCNLIRAIARLKSENAAPIALHLWCELSSATRWENKTLAEIIKENDVDDSVFVHEYVPHPQALHIQKTLDLLVIFAFGQLPQIPAKAYEYLLSGTYIIAFCEENSETWRLLDGYENVKVISANDYETVLAALRQVTGEIRGGYVHRRGQMERLSFRPGMERVVERAGELIAAESADHDMAESR